MNIKIDVNEALRYLGCKAYDAELAKIATECINEIKVTMTPRWTYRVFSVCPDDYGVKILDSDINFKSNDIKTLLKYSNQCIIMAVTLGAAIDKRISLYQKTNMSKAVVYDACASAAVEGLCDYVTGLIKADDIVKFLTMRFSPGYGDFDISYQKSVINLTDAYKHIGLTATSSMLLTPSKSVTAIMGITDKPYMVSRGGCESCVNFQNCAYRKSGSLCER